MSVEKCQNKFCNIFSLGSSSEYTTKHLPKLDMPKLSRVLFYLKMATFYTHRNNIPYCIQVLLTIEMKIFLENVGSLIKPSESTKMDLHQFTLFSCVKISLDKMI